MSSQSNHIDLQSKIVYVDGVFDMFHYGHISFLNKVKLLGNFLIVGVISDEDTISYKRQPVIPYEYRVKMLENCKLVDKVVPSSPLIITNDFIKKHSIDIVAHGDDSTQSDFFKVPIELGIMKYVPYTSGISTTQIISDIKTRTFLK